MRRAGGLFLEVSSRENLYAAWRDFRRGKRGRRNVASFEQRAAREVLALERELRAGAYRPGAFRLLPLFEPKHRLVAAAPVRDRVVHHAIHRVLAPRLDPRLIDATYACLPGRGSHRAALAFVAGLRRYRFVLLLDVRHYFLSIDRAILLDVMAALIKDRPLLELLRVVADSGRGLYRSPGVPEFLGLAPGFPPESAGLPIGNLTSQWWGNHYLSGLDHFVKRERKIPHYQRYMDDMALFSDDRGELAAAREAITEWLGVNRKLRLKHPYAEPKDGGARFTYLGFRVSRRGIGPTRSALARMQQRIREQILRGHPESVQRTIASYRGVLGMSLGCTVVSTASVNAGDAMAHSVTNRVRDGSSRDVAVRQDVDVSTICKSSGLRPEP